MIEETALCLKEQKIMPNVVLEKIQQFPLLVHRVCEVIRVVYRSLTVVSSPGLGIQNLNSHNFSKSHNKGSRNARLGVRRKSLIVRQLDC